MKIKYSFSILAISLLFIACSKDFLEIGPTEYISGEQLKEISVLKPELQESNVLGLYSTMYMAESGGLSGNQTDFGQKGLDVIVDMIIGDINKPNTGYGWYNNVLQYQATTDKTILENYMPWRYYYRIIYAANNIIEALGGVDATFSNDDNGTKSRHYLGQAIGMRGYCYYYLAQYFTVEYKPEEMLVPIYRSPNDLDLSVESQKNVYDQAIADLTKATELLNDFNRGDKSAVNADVARGLLAYTYAAIGDYANAGKFAKAIIDEGKYTPMTPVEIVYNDETKTGSGFNSVTIPGWIWGADIEPSTGLNLVSFWGQMDVFTYSYPSVGAPRVISNALYNAIRDDDVRKNQFRSLNYGSAEKPNVIAGIPYNKFFTPERKIQGQRYISTDYVYMRVSEMYMLYIESLAFQNKDSETKTELKKYLEGRIADLSYIDALSGDALKKEIQLQWRIEFWGEGKAYQAAKRFKNPIVLGTNRFDSQNAGAVIQYNDPKLCFKIPENEELNNPNLYGKKE